MFLSEEIPRLREPSSLGMTNDEGRSRTSTQDVD